ncbi:MAG TPA: YceD family protein [Burkholderiales bacterium]|nr:YceD family protein [Burkholderiales bacterium]
MSAQAAQAVIDSPEFARTGQSLSGQFPVAALPRLQDCIADNAGEVRFAVKGGHDARRRPVLTLEISGVLHLRCQRCLGALDHKLDLSNTLLLTSGVEAGEAEEEADCIEASAALDVAGLVEDEILLSLPYAPRHREGQCPPGSVPAAGEKQSGAFAKLAALKRNNDNRN